MYIVFDGVSTKWYIGLFDENKQCISSENFRIAWNESTKTVGIIDDFLKRNAISYHDIQNIVCIVWPGSFTWIRTISLVVNTLAYSYKNISLTALNFFDLYNNYPIIKASSKRDLFVKSEKSATIEVVTNSDFEERYRQWHVLYWDINEDRFQDRYIYESEIDYEAIFQAISLTNEKRVSPLYIKKPNIS